MGPSRKGRISHGGNKDTSDTRQVRILQGSRKEVAVPPLAEPRFPEQVKALAQCPAVSGRGFFCTAIVREETRRRWCVASDLSSGHRPRASGTKAAVEVKNPPQDVHTRILGSQPGSSMSLSILLASSPALTDLPLSSGRDRCPWP